MNQIDNLSNEASQETRVTLDDGTVVDILLTYRPAIQRWSLNVTRGTFVVDGINLCVFPNIVREWRHIIPFGIACLTTDGADPVSLDDFSNGRATLFVLDAAEVASAEATILGAGV